MLVYRISQRKYASDISGTGAALYGGRWNKKGAAVLYTGESREIALLETIVHTPPMLVPDLEMLTLEFPDDSITELSIDDLPANWHHYPAPANLAEIADAWIHKNTSLALKVPSCIIHTANLYILNCRHPNFQQVKVLSQAPFHFDRRLQSSHKKNL
jgi:RES domain-containing protein